MKKEVNNMSIKKAAFINAAAKYSNVIFMLIANVILSRILSVEDYGIVAVITVFVTFFSLLSDFGLGSGIIQNKELTDNDVNNIFSYTIYFGVILCITFWGIGYLVSLFYKNGVYIPIGFVLSISIFFNTINMIPNAILLKEKHFVKIAIRTIVVYVFSYTCAILMALKGFSYYSLVFQSVISSIVTFLWNYLSVKLKFIFRPSFNSLKKILSYSAYTFLYEILNYFGRNLDNILTGKLMGNEALGYYNKAYHLMLYPVNYLTNVITPILHPILSDYQKNKEIVFEKYIKLLKCLSLMGVIFSVFCFFASKEIVLILYGKKWLMTVPCISILSISIWFQMTTSTCTSIFKSLGDTKLRLKSGIIYVTLQIILIVIGAYQKNIVILSAFVASSFIIRFFVEYFFLINKAFRIKYVRFIKIFIPDLIIAVFTSCVMFLFSYVKIKNLFVSIILKGVVCLAAFIIASIFTKQLKHFINLLPKKIQKKLVKEKGEVYE